MTKNFTGNDAIRELQAQRDPKLVEARRQMTVTNSLNRKAIPQSFAVDGDVNPTGAPMRLYADVLLTASGNTVTGSPSDSKIVSIYVDSTVGWIEKTLEAAITLSTVGYTSGTLYDIFTYWDNSIDSFVLATVIWASETARTTALTTIDGKSVLSTDKTYLYLATGRYNGSTMLLPTMNPNGELFFGTGDPRNNVADPATGVGMYAAGVSLGGTVYNFFSILNGTVGWGVDLLGNLIAIAGGFKINASGMSLTVSGNLVMSITAAYALFGSNVAAANTTAFAIFFTAQTYNTESMEAGSTLSGSNSSTYANVLWRPSTKQLQFRNGTTVQWYVDVNGKATAGSGAITQDSEALTIESDGANFVMPGTNIYNAIWNVPGSGFQALTYETVSPANPGNNTFETGSLSSWTAAGGAVISSAFAHGGTYSAKLPTGGSIVDDAFVAAGLGNLVMSFWAYTTSAGATLEPEIRCYNAGSTLVNTILPSSAYFTFETTGRWKRYFISGVNDGTKFKVFFQSIGGDIYIDDITVYDTGILRMSGYAYGSGSGAQAGPDLSVIRNLTVGNVISAPNVAVGPNGEYSWITLPKYTSETIQSDNTVNNDSELILALAVSDYSIRGIIFFDTSAAADFKYRFNFTGTTTLVRARVSHVVPGTTAGVPLIETAFPTTTVSVVGAGTTGGYIEFDFIVEVSGAGNFIFQWSQNTSDASNTTVRARSYFEYKV